MISTSELASRRQRVLDFVNGLNTGRAGEYRYSITGVPNLYASCYALMTLHYLNGLPAEKAAREAWADYILSFQDADSGLFLGPELLEPLPTGAKHDSEHLGLHLAITVLPCLDILGARPRYPLYFAHRFLAKDVLADWLAARDWRDAWLEGNNLLFVLQLLIFLREDERQPDAQDRIDQFFAWLDQSVDPATGLWGTNGYCSRFVAMCGGYHQLLAYYSEGRPLTSPTRLVDVTLALQHADGGFHPTGGGGACEDVDAVDILVNLYKQQNYRRPEIRVALRNAVKAVLDMQVPDGGFVYRRRESFSHMGMEATRTPPDHSNLFATWFRVHALALAAQALTHTTLGRYPWQFNPRMSMGWHQTSLGAPIFSAFRAPVDEISAVGLRRFIKSRLNSAMVQYISRYV